MGLTKEELAWLDANKDTHVRKLLASYKEVLQERPSGAHIRGVSRHLKAIRRQLTETINELDEIDFI